MQTLSKPDARRLILAAQGLAVAGTFGRGARATLAAVEHLGYVQIDTISVIQRAHHHVLWTRIPHYRPEFLHQLMAQREVFEYWSHAAAFLPMREYRYSLPRKRMYQQGKRHWFELTPEHQVWRRRILRQIREHGPQSARDFATPGERARSGWFDWKPAKQMLEQLFQEGVLMITARRGFEKVYDLAERVLPTDVDQRPPSPRMYAEHLLASSLRANGLSRPVEAAYLRHKPIRDEVARTLARGVRDGRLLTVQVENETFVADAAAFERLMDVPVGADLHILSPFDNLVIQRARLNTFFDFEYTLECYVPEAKRQFGYFGLPVLWRDQMVGVLDLKADRSSGVLYVRNARLKRIAHLREVLSAKLKAFAQFNGCEHVQWGLKRRHKFAPQQDARQRERNS